MEDSTIVPRISLSYRISGKHLFDFGWFAVKREGTAITDKEIEIGDETIPINSKINSFFNTEIYEFKYTVGYKITKKFIFSARADQFLLEYGNYSGSLIDSTLAFEYLPFKHVGFGFGWNMLALKVKADSEKIYGEFENTFSGFLFFTSVYF